MVFICPYNLQYFVNPFPAHIIHSYEKTVWAKRCFFGVVIVNSHNEMFVQAKPLSYNVKNVPLCAACEYEYMAFYWWTVCKVGHIEYLEIVYFVYCG